MNRFFAVLLFLSLSVSAYGESIDGPANVRLQPKGRAIMSLNDHVDVYVEKHSGDWYQLALEIAVANRDIKNGLVMKGAKIRETPPNQNLVIGAAVSPFKLVPKDQQESGFVAGQVEAFTYKSNIKSIVVQNKDLLRNLESGYYLSSEYVDRQARTYSTRGGWDAHPIFGEFQVTNPGDLGKQVTFLGGNFHEGIIQFFVDFNGVSSGSACFDRFCIRTLTILDDKSFSIDLNGRIETFYCVKGFKEVK